MDNQIYGLTTGQTSPTSRIGMKTKSTPFGSIETSAQSHHSGALGGRHVRRARLLRRAEHLTELIKQAIQHKGFSFLDIFSPCVTYNQDNTFQWFRPRVKKLEDDASLRRHNWIGGDGEVDDLWGEEIPIGKFFERTDLPALHEAEPVTQGRTMLSYPLHIDPAAAQSFIDELM